MTHFQPRKQNLDSLLDIEQAENINCIRHKFFKITCRTKQVSGRLQYYGKLLFRFQVKDVCVFLNTCRKRKDSLRQA